MSNDDKVVERVSRKGFDFFPGATKWNGKREMPMYFYMVTLQWSPQPGVVGYGTRLGIMIPRDGSQTGEWYTELLTFLYESLPTYRPNALPGDPPPGFPLSIVVEELKTYREPSEDIPL